MGASELTFRVPPILRRVPAALPRAGVGHQLDGTPSVQHDALRTSDGLGIAGFFDGRTQ